MTNNGNLEIDLSPPTFGLDAELTAAGFTRHKYRPFVWTAPDNADTRKALSRVSAKRDELAADAKDKNRRDRESLAPGTHVKVATSLTYKPKGARKPRSLDNAYWQVQSVNSDGTVTVVAQVQGPSTVFGGSSSSVTATVPGSAVTPIHEAADITARINGLLREAATGIDMPLRDLIKLADPNVPLDALRSQERGYLNTLKSKIRREGLLRPIDVLVRDGKPVMVWDGMHRLAVLDELNWKTVPVRFVNNKSEPVAVDSL